MSGWRINISLLADEIIDNSAAFGVSNKSNRELDHLDFRRPRTISSIPMVYFHHPEWDPNYSNFATDIRSEFDKAESWKFNLLDNERKTLQLNFIGVENIPSDFEIYLIDLVRGNYVDLKTHSGYDFKAISDISKFKVIVGHEKEVTEELSLMYLPNNFVLANNYPNPFNRYTTISMEIPIESKITLKIYNLLGEEVKTIYDGSIQTGNYWFDWDGTNNIGIRISSGIYIYSLFVDSGISLSKKLIVLN